jgi:pimeloyl-ACP methyl ester carboxylesterase
MENFRDGRTQPPLSALWSDPPNDLTHPARTLPQAIPSCSANLNAVLYQASGPGPNPTALLLHGLPGNEQNLDCAQSLRRSGFNVLTIHYRGSWGNPGVFTIANCLSDAAAALEWLRDSANGSELRIDRQGLVVVGQCMGGFVAAHLASENVDVLGTAVISGVDFETVFGAGDAERASEIVDDNVGFSAGLHILAGTSREKLAAEARRNALRWSLPSFASRLAGPRCSSRLPTTVSVQEPTYSQMLSWPSTAETSHAYTSPRITATSACRIELQSRLLLWLDMALGRPSACPNGSQTSSNQG